MVHVANHQIAPLGDEVAGSLDVVGIQTPARSLAPRQITQLVGPIVETLLEDLLVQTRAVEARGHREFDIALQSLVRRSRPNTVGIEALIEHQTLVVGFVVEIDLIALGVDLTHAEIGLGAIDRLARGILQLEHHIVKERRFGAPQLGLLDRQRNHRTRRHGRRVTRHHLAAVENAHRKLVARCIAAHGHLHRHLAAVYVGHVLDARDSARSHGLHPHRLPDARRTRVHALERTVTQRLLARRLHAAAKVALGVHDQRVRSARLDELGNIHRERVRAAEVAVDELAVDVDLRLVIHRAEVQQHVLALPRGGHRDFALVPDAGYELLVADAREFALGSERHRNLAVESAAVFQTALPTRLDGI